MPNETAERKQPRVSINKLGEYLTGTPRNRRRIIEQQKRPPGFAISYYQPAQKAIVEFLESGATEHSVITDAIDKLERKTPKSDWEAHRIQGCIEALETFYDNYDEVLDLEGRRFERGKNSAPKLHLEGVEVSIRPELLVFGEDENGRQTAGAIKLYFGKNSPLDPEMGKYIATSTHQWVEEHLVPDNYEAPHRETGVYDVFSNTCIRAPRSYIRRRRDIQAACDEIGMMWEQV